MHSNWVILGLAALVGTCQAYLPQNQLCGSNKECASNCQDGEYHIMSDGNSTTPYFACKLVVRPYYQTTSCSDKADFRKNIARGPCEAAGGEFCEPQSGIEFCYLLDSDVKKFHSACEQANGKPRNVGDPTQTKKTCGAK